MAPKIGFKQSEETKQKIRLSKIGSKNPMYGVSLKLSEETRKKISIANTGKNNGMWRGDNIGYAKLHQYIRRHLPEPKSCPICKSNKTLDLSNITGIYNREFKNWQYLCRPCHRKYDNVKRGGFVCPLPSCKRIFVYYKNAEKHCATHHLWEEE